VYLFTIDEHTGDMNNFQPEDQINSNGRLIQPLAVIQPQAVIQPARVSQLQAASSTRSVNIYVRNTTDVQTAVNPSTIGAQSIVEVNASRTQSVANNDNNKRKYFTRNTASIKRIKLMDRERGVLLSNQAVYEAIHYVTSKKTPLRYMRSDCSPDMSLILKTILRNSLMEEDFPDDFINHEADAIYDHYARNGYFPANLIENSNDADKIRTLLQYLN